MTRSVWLNREHERAHARDDATVVFPCRFAVGSVLPGAFAAGSFERLFRENYPAIRELLNRHREAGLALVVVRKDGLEASAWLAAKEGEINPCIIGRHSSADVFLPSDPSLSLRHLAVILYRREEERPVRFRVLDLRTATAFADEEGNRLEAVEAQGPLMLQCASFAILLFPSGGSNEPWPEDPDVAWRRIPERVYLERECADPARWLAPGGGARRAVPQAIEAGDRNRTLVDSFPGPIFVPWVLEGSGRARGEIVVSSSQGRVSLPLSVSAARQGVLLGRYERCDTAGLPVLSSWALSRVHLLMIELDGALYAVDTASKNGSWLEAGSVRAARVEPGLRLMLARHATVEWRSFH